MIWKLISLVTLLSVISVSTYGAELYSYKDESFTYILPHGDSKYQFIRLEKPIHFFTEKYDHIYINTNGILTFGAEFSDFLNLPFPLEYPSIAPFYSNVDTTNANESSTIVFLKSENPDKLKRASNLITLSFSDDYEFEATTLYVATWDNVGYFQGKQDKLNTFQAAIICNEDETYVQFTYPSDGINWLKGDAGELGLPDIRAQAGFISEDGRFFTLPGSGNENARYLSSESNIGIPGVWLYRIGMLDYKSNVQEPNNAQLKGDQIPPRNCAEGLWKKCHSAAICEDNQNGFSCTCNEGYYGNGRSCIKNNQDIRVTGSISGKINGIPLDERSKLQSYVVLSDGRSYTAINPINEVLGSQLKLATPIGGAIGWLFAKPVGENIWNGFQFTGGKLNHFSTLRFARTGEVFQINQTFDGLNYWDQLVVNIEVSGELPDMPFNEKFVMNDYVEEYNQLSRNAIQSVSNRKIEIQSVPEPIEFEVEQLITFSDSVGSDKINSQPPRQLFQRLSKISIDYFMHEQALRVGVLAKIGTTVETHPCQDGTANCGENTKCIEVEGDDYDCMCLNGYMPDDSIDEVVRCIDIDECSSPNVCDENAVCRNIDGGYECRCSSGFVGNGYDCTDASVAPLSETQQRETESQTEQEIDNNQEHAIVPETLYPSSTSGYENSYDSSTARYDYPEENHCEDCSPEAECVGGRCQCRDGYSGDGFSCTYNCQSNENWSSGRCVESYEDEQTEVEPNCLEEIGECTCPEGYNYLEEENICRNALRNSNHKHEEHTIPCDVEFNCSPNATCQWNEIESSYGCECLRGYEGDGFDCYKIEVSCTTKSDLCDPNASCLYVEALGKSQCKCDYGYVGDGFTCQLAPECDHDEHCSINAYCANGVCLCKEGFERDQSDFCVPAGKCGGTYCADNAICKWEAYQKVQYCECLEGYIGDGLTSCKSVPPACNVRNTCGLYASCVPSFRELGKYECVCDAGFYGDGYVCVEEKNCRNTPSLCDPHAQCLTTAGGLSCVCNQGYLGNGTVCNQITAHESGFLLISQGVVIIRVPFNGKSGHPITVASMAIGLDKDCVEGRVYWGDISAKKIVSAKYDGSDSRPFITEDVESPEGIAIDSVSRRLYWTDSTKDTIEVASLDNPALRTVIVHKHLVNPRGIAVDPYKNKLYWSDWNRDAPKIEMSDLDGTGREILLSKPNLILPNSLVVLPSSGELCYVDAGTHRAECIDTYSKEIRTVAETLDYPFGLAASEDHIYWTDWKTKQVESIDLNGNRKQGLRTPFFGSHKMYGMTAIVESCPLSYSPCQINNGGCPDERICLVQPNAPSSQSCKCTKLSKQCNYEQFYED